MMHWFWSVSVVVVVVTLAGRATSYPDGAPQGTCSHLTPSHSGSNVYSNINDEKFVITLERHSTNKVKVTLKPKTGTPKFAGFLLRATLDKTASGYFDLSATATNNAVYQKSQCQKTIDGRERFAVTHTEADIKDSVVMDWVEVKKGNVLFESTVVINRFNYYTDVKNSISA